MTKYIKHPRKGFTLIELLTVIAIIGILAAIIIPTVGKVRETAKRSVASSNLRQVGQASLIYATDNNDGLPKSSTGGDASGAAQGLEAITFRLASGGGLNDAQIWFAGQDDTNATGVSTVMNSAKTGIESNFKVGSSSYAYVSGLIATDSSTTPIAWTRGLGNKDSWTNDKAPWKKDGGHIVFLGGNVSWFKKLDANTPLINASTGATTNNVQLAIPTRLTASSDIVGERDT